MTRSVCDDSYQDHWPECACYDCDDFHGRCRRCGGGKELPVDYVGIRATRYIPCPDCEGTGLNAEMRAAAVDDPNFLSL